MFGCVRWSNLRARDPLNCLLFGGLFGRANLVFMMSASDRSVLIHRRYAQVIFVFIFVFYAFVVVIAQNPPAFVDYPDWVYQGVLFHGVLTRSPIFGYAMKPYPVPNTLTTIGIGALNLIVPWQWAGKLWICIYFLLAIVATFRLARVLNIKSRALWYALPNMVFLNLNFWYGHINFEFGLCVLLFFASILFENRLYKTGYAWVLVLLFFIHMEACACGILLFLCFCLSRRRFKLILQCLPVCLLVAWYTIARFSHGNIDGVIVPSQNHYASMKFIVFKIQTFFKTMGYLNVTGPNGFSKTEAIFGRNVTVLLVGISFSIGSVLLVSFLRQILREQKIYSQVRFGWIFVVALLLIAMMLPQTLLGTADPGSRLVLVSLAMMLFLISQGNSRAMWFIATGSLILCVTNFCQFSIVEAKPRIIARKQAPLPLSMDKYAHIDPETRLCYYQSLSVGKMDLPIFSTALFYETVKHPQSFESCEKTTQ
jgi:hypothetical protein